MKLVFLGDSLTAGRYGGDFVAEVAKLRPDDEIINAGIGGNTVINLERRLDAIIEQAPDGVFVMVGGNDSISYTQPDTRPYYKKAQDIPQGFVPPELFAQAYRDILQRLQLAFIPVWVGLPPNEYNPQTLDALKQYNALARAAAQSMNIPVLDLMAEFAPDSVPERPAIGLRMINTIGQRSADGWADFEAARSEGGFTFTFDGLHIMPETAKRVAVLINQFIQG